MHTRDELCETSKGMVSLRSQSRGEKFFAHDGEVCQVIHQHAHHCGFSQIVSAACASAMSTPPRPSSCRLNQSTRHRALRLTNGIVFRGL